MNVGREKCRGILKFNSYRIDLGEYLMSRVMESIWINILWIVRKEMEKSRSLPHGSSDVCESKLKIVLLRKILKFDEERNQPAIFACYLSVAISSYLLGLVGWRVSKEWRQFWKKWEKKEGREKGKLRKRKKEERKKEIKKSKGQGGGPPPFLFLQRFFQPLGYDDASGYESRIMVPHTRVFMVWMVGLECSFAWAARMYGLNRIHTVVNIVDDTSRLFEQRNLWSRACWSTCHACFK